MEIATFLERARSFTLPHHPQRLRCGRDSHSTVVCLEDPGVLLYAFLAPRSVCSALPPSLSFSDARQTDTQIPALIAPTHSPDSLDCVDPCSPQQLRALHCIDPRQKSEDVADRGYDSTSSGDCPRAARCISSSQFGLHTEVWGSIALASLAGVAAGTLFDQPTYTGDGRKQKGLGSGWVWANGALSLWLR